MYVPRGLWVLSLFKDEILKLCVWFIKVCAFERRVLGKRFEVDLEDGRISEVLLLMGLGLGMFWIVVVGVPDFSGIPRCVRIAGVRVGVGGFLGDRCISLFWGCLGWVEFR